MKRAFNRGNVQMVKPALYSATADMKVKGKDELLMALSDGRKNNHFSGKRKTITIGQKFVKTSFTRLFPAMGIGKEKILPLCLGVQQLLLS